MKLQLGDIWISDTHPHESFEIYGGVLDTCTDTEVRWDKYYEEQPESIKILFWRKHDLDVFNTYADKNKKNKENQSTYPYAWCGECKKYSLTKKIKEYNMRLSNESCEVECAIVG